jgi:hypothetical protein
MPTNVTTAESALERRRAWVIGLALLCSYAFFYYLGGNWNVEARNAQIVALAEHRSLAIDDYEHWTGDKAHYRGHYYSDKLIGPSLAGTPVFWVARRVVSIFTPRPLFALMLSLRITNLITNAAPTAFLAALLYLFLAEVGIGPQLRVWLAFGYGWGTLALPYSTALFGHQFGAVCAFCAFVLLWRQRQEWRPARALGAGALAGLGAISDFTTALMCCFLALYAIWVAAGRSERRADSLGPAIVRLAPFAAALVVTVSPQLIANWSSFGSPLTFPHVHHVQPSFRLRHTAGLLGVHLPRLFPLYQLTFGSWRGLFRGSPMLLLALPGFFLLDRRWRAEAVLTAAEWVGVLLMSAGYENWTAGSVYGPRYQIAAIPLLMLPTAAAAKRLPLVFQLLAVLSILLMGVVTAQSPFVDEALRDPLANALGLFFHGQLLHGNLGRLIGLPGLFGLLPLVLIEAAFLLALLRLRSTDKRG